MRSLRSLFLIDNDRLKRLEQETLGLKVVFEVRLVRERDIRELEGSPKLMALELFPTNSLAWVLGG